MFKKRASSWNCLYFDWSIVYIWPWSKSENTRKKLDEIKCTNIEAYVFHFELKLFRYAFQPLQFNKHSFIANWVSWLDLYFSEVSLVVFYLSELTLSFHFSVFAVCFPYFRIETITNVLHDWIFRCMKKRKCKQPFIIHSNNKYTTNNRIWNTTN